jgi:hypothetical protein
MATKKRASAKKSTTKKGTAQSSGKKEGLKKLSQEADKTIGEDCGVIVSALRNKAKAGNICCAKLLVQLAERADAEEAETAIEQPCESLAAWLATEPEWPGFPKPGKKDAK